MMVGKTKPRNKEEQERIEFVKLHMGCLPCILVTFLNCRCNYNHVCEGRKRLGHRFGYGSCGWHDVFHVSWDGRSTQEMIGQLGPSLGHGKITFEEVFGDELLLVRTVDYALELFKENPCSSFPLGPI
ncbi:MAG: hypothetical protein IH997_04550 [Proteobacteria bacterium]|nr:hypothetical protein [Pseudomonadota bacterium]